ncbi:MAG: hypothetical protein V8R97_03450 [Fusicatenibacter saccharivorans]
MVRTWKDRMPQSYYIFDTMVFRFVMVPEMTAKSHDSGVEMYLNRSLKQKTNLQKMKICYIYETNQLSLHFSKNYWEMSMGACIKVEGNTAIIVRRREIYRSRWFPHRIFAQVQHL